MAGAFNPTFLLLPRETRDRIYLCVLRSSVQIPPSTPDQDVIERSTYSRDRYCPSFVAYEMDKLPGIVPSLGLLRCCQQTRSELQELITHEDRNECQQPLYRLDCILQAYRISTTWIALPTSLVYVHRLEISIRAFTLYKVDSLEQAGQQGLLRLLFPFRTIYDLLYRLFNHGPRFYECHSRPNRTFIRTLILHLSEEVTKEEVKLPLGNIGGLITDSVTLRQEVSFDRIWQCICGLKSYGLLRGRVDTIRICFGLDIKEVQVNNGTSISRVRIATSGEWLAWLYRWPKDDLSHPSDT